jgi:putative DNA primase/helicase
MTPRKLSYRRWRLAWWWWRHWGQRRGLAPPPPVTEEFIEYLSSGPKVMASFSDNYEPPGQLTGPRHATTDAGNSLRFTEDHEGELIYVKGPGWHIWDGKRWLRNDDAAIVAAKETARRIRFEAAAQQVPDQYKRVFAHAFQSEGRARLQAMVALASKGEIAGPGLVVPVERLDARPHLLNCRNGTVNLKTGRLSPHRKEDYLTHLIDVDYDPKAAAPRWQRFLREVFKDNAKLIEYVQRLSGYSVTGSNTEKLFVIAHGETDTGKSVYSETLGLILGELAHVALADTFVSQNQRSGNPAHDLACMRGARFVRVPETGDNERLARQVIKTITGADKVAARFLYKEPFSYRPQFKIWIVTNHLPQVPHTDAATWNRIRVIPFRQQAFRATRRRKPPPGVVVMDRELRSKLEKELPGILTWLVQGAYKWFRSGLGEEPIEAVEAKFDYRASQDTVGRFLDDEVVDDPESRVETTAMNAEYKRWCQSEGLRPIGRNAFHTALRDRGYHGDSKDSQGVRYYPGVRLSGA